MEKIEISKANVSAELRQLPHFQQLLEAHGVILAYLFGSTAQGNATPLSDVDIALVVENFDPARRLALELQIEDEFVRQCGVAQADVRIINEAPLAIRGEVVTIGQLLYAKTAEQQIDFETSTRKAYFDFQPALQYHQQNFFQRLKDRGLNAEYQKSSGDAG